MIPTRYKSKLSRLMSYPTSAGRLSTALAEMPQIDELSVAFFDSCQDPRHLENPCHVLSIGYGYLHVSLSTGNDSIEQGRYGGQWTITVDPVPRTLVSRVRTQLNEEGFAKIRQWLLLYRNVTGKKGRCWFRCLYDMDIDRLCYQETDWVLS